ncbi:flavodoxin-dependent (E)-4-hydroxy-3-methylbut-2-enyl-diphosphate synthase [Metallumcola ferriviriculae]|uniref:4-hydroxy-3-methylbut-2-en-1-yl diphosphate synthase (flavodoxin) n=1 Tax=Metallumcola ferriviriculae TaxID=3039180 RepID=A0AAU0UNZ2_9FIRM|nr:flavodoxin-dependent (E)-4-hydroxy-3-methylbut-2-enyl-diphosphate synthase [Desulfitibacteraceae bacterium MK1]
MFTRRQTRVIHLGNVAIGGNHPVSVQSMTNTDTRDISATIDQIQKLHDAGCQIVRVAVPDKEAADALGPIVKAVELPIIADIHFNYRLAIEAINQGVDGLRLNPGNIGGALRVRQVMERASAAGTPIRIGVNAGSLQKEHLKQYGGVTAQAMVDSAIEHIRLLEQERFHDIKISLKASNIPLMVEAYQLLSKQVDYPFHIGVTEAGLPGRGAVKSAVGIGVLLSQGLGDTVRVSLTGDPVEEVKVALDILQALGLAKHGAELISCPTCGRCQLDLLAVAREVEERIKNIKKPITVAVMGCAVNGPGEARQADVGIAGGKDGGLIFRHGKVVKRVRQEDLVSQLVKEIDKIISEEDNNESQQTIDADAAGKPI